MSHITVTLFESRLGALVGYLALFGAASIMSGIEAWLRRRFTLDLNPLALFTYSRPGLLWRDFSLCVPRRFRVHRRWDRSGAIVVMDDGREATVLLVADSDDAPGAGAMALVQPYEEYSEDDYPVPPVWIGHDRLSRRKREVAA